MCFLIGALRSGNHYGEDYAWRYLARASYDCSCCGCCGACVFVDPGEAVAGVVVVAGRRMIRDKSMYIAPEKADTFDFFQSSQSALLLFTFSLTPWACSSSLFPSSSVLLSLRSSVPPFAWSYLQFFFYFPECFLATWIVFWETNNFFLIFFLMKPNFYTNSKPSLLIMSITLPSSSSSLSTTFVSETEIRVGWFKSVQRFFQEKNSPWIIAIIGVFCNPYPYNDADKVKEIPTFISD